MWRYENHNHHNRVKPRPSFYTIIVGLGGSVVVFGAKSNNGVAFRRLHSFSFIHSDHFYSASSSPLLLRGAPGIAQILCRSFTPKCHMQLQVKNLPKVNTWRLEQESNPWPFGWKASSLPMHYTRPTLCTLYHVKILSWTWLSWKTRDCLNNR